MSEPSIGHNSSAFAEDIENIDPLGLAPPPDYVRRVLAHNYVGSTDHRDGFIADMVDWLARHTPEDSETTVIEDEEDCLLTKDFLDQVTGFIAEIEATRKQVKQALIDAGSEVDTFFKEGITEALAAQMPPIKEAYAAYLDRLKLQRKAELDDAAAKAQEEVDRLVALQSRTKNKDALKDKIEAAEARAAEAKAATEVSLRDLTRIRTDSNRVGGLKEVWKWRLAEPSGMMDLVLAVHNGHQPSDGKPLIDMLTLNRVEINNRVRHAKGLRKVPGLEIYPEEKAT